MLVSYTIFDPTKNITALITTSVPRALQPAAAAELMRRIPEVEQVGFLEPAALAGTALRLQMMGGEFCGNASLSAAVFAMERGGLSGGEAALEVSGAEGPVRCRIAREGDHFVGTVQMPLPTRIGSAVLPPRESGRSVPAVWFPGIVHCIVPAASMSREEAESLIRPAFPQLCRSLRADACGILLYDQAGGAFTPLVYVAETNTAVWESGCGSGSAAIGVWSALTNGGSAAELSLRQPGGVIRVGTELCGGRIRSLTITGTIRRVSEGQLELPL